ncbi:MAG: hypothetical protein L3J09_01660 [Flavobacteriaceae bacterium]|nr:hypothetical protein [Flavobacteriaceae bacterium]
MKGIYKITLFLLVVLLLAACSRKKNTFLSRSKHSVTAEFNALYNGNLAFETGKEDLARSYRDDFWEILPVERLQLDEDKVLPGQNENPNFNKAEEKATKAIQQHSIYIDGTEYNPQIDEAFILLGKARYFDARFVQALDAFNFILKTYPTSNSINHAKVWKAKTNIRLNNEEVAIDNLKQMFKREEISEEDYADASAIIAQAFINLDSLKTALPYIVRASEKTKNKELKGRYLYIKGQLYNALDMKDRANFAFDEVIALNRKTPRVYMINAYIEKAKNFDFTKEDRVAFLELLYDLEKDRENRPFLDKIYHQIGEYYRKNDSIDLAVEFYNKSLDAYQDDSKMQAVNYQTLAEIYFDYTEYKIAGAYYDSTLANLAEGTRLYRRIKKKRVNLDDVIKYEDIATENDSIIGLVNMNEAERLSYFTNYTENIKAQAIEDSLSRVEQENNIANNEFYQGGKNNFNNQKGGPSGPSTFYFYNSSTISFGKQEFKKRWGKRKLEDNWRLSNKLSKLETLDETETIAPIAENDLYKPSSYIARIPSDEVVIDSITKERNFAYYQLGLIYKEKFKEYDLATNRLTTLLSFNPEKRLVLPALYNLHKINVIQENEILANQYKNEILTRYPDSRYAEILRNPNAILATDESSPEFKYKKLFEEFENSKYQQVISTSDEYISNYFGNPIVPKFELLKANAIGRQQGFEPYKKALNFVSLNYPNSKEGKEALNLYKTLLPRIANKSFLSDKESERWKIVYSFNKSNNEGANNLKETLADAIKNYHYEEMSISVDYYTPEQQFVIIHGLTSKQGARGFAEVLKENKKYKVSKPYFEINSENYKIIQIHKNLDVYLETDLSKEGLTSEELKKLSPTERKKVRKEKEGKESKANQRRESKKSKTSTKSSRGKAPNKNTNTNPNRSNNTNSSNKTKGRKG